MDEENPALAFARTLPTVLCLKPMEGEILVARIVTTFTLPILESATHPARRGSAQSQLLTVRL